MQREKHCKTYNEDEEYQHVDDDKNMKNKVITQK
jgi:hypothetical protein